jgi:hypothetical protein
MIVLKEPLTHSAYSSEKMIKSRAFIKSAPTHQPKCVHCSHDVKSDDRLCSDCDELHGWKYIANDGNTSVIPCQNKRKIRKFLQSTEEVYNCTMCDRNCNEVDGLCVICRARCKQCMIQVHIQLFDGLCEDCLDYNLYLSTSDSYSSSIESCGMCEKVKVMWSGLCGDCHNKWY